MTLFLLEFSCVLFMSELCKDFKVKDQVYLMCVLGYNRVSPVA